MFKTPKFTQMPEPPTFKYENVQTEVEKPMNPNAKEAFKEAIEKAKKCPAIDYLYFEPKHEEAHINKAVLTSRYYLDEFVNALLNEGYVLTLKRAENEVVTEITWKDKNDLTEEIKKMARELEETL